MLLKSKKDFALKFMMAFRPAADRLKSESPAVSGIPTKEAQERSDNDSAAICSDFGEGEVGGGAAAYCPVICADAQLIITCPVGE